MRKSTLKTNLFVFLSFAFLWLLLTLTSGSLFSGYHFMDDSLIIRYDQMIREQGVLHALRHYLTDDFSTRFRPVWVAEFILGIYVKGSNFVLWSIVRSLFIALTNTILFAFALKSGLTLRKSLLFSLLIMLGQQTAILWMLGPAEVSGIFFMSLALYAIPRKCEDKPLSTLWFISSIVLMSLSKESFIFMIPAIYIWLIWAYSITYNLGFFQAISRNLLIAIILAVIMLGEIYVLYSISTRFNYAGADKSLGVSSYIKALLFLMVFSISGLVALAGFILLILKKQFRPKKWFYPALLLAAIVLPQILIYAKSGIAERYFLPAVTGFVILIIHQLVIIDKDPVHYFINKKVAMIVSLLSTMVLALGLMLAFSEGIRAFIIKTMYGFRGDVVQQMNPLEIVIARSSNNIRVMGWGIMLIGLALVAGCIVLIVLKVKTFRLYHAFMIVVLLSVGINLVSVFGLARKFAKEGEAVNGFIAGIVEHTGPNDAILVVADTWVHMEASCAGLPAYLNIKNGRNNLYGIPVSLDAQNPASQADNVFYRVYKKYTPSIPYPCIAFFPGTEELLLADTSAHPDLSLYKKEALGNGYVVYSLK